MKAYTTIMAFALCIMAPPLSAEDFKLLETLSPESELVPRRVACGMSRDQVLEAAGKPDTLLSQEVWVFEDFRTERIVDKHFDTLLVIFREEKVLFMKFVTNESLKRLVLESNKKMADLYRAKAK